MDGMKSRVSNNCGLAVVPEIAPLGASRDKGKPLHRTRTARSFPPLWLCAVPLSPSVSLFLARSPPPLFLHLRRVCGALPSFCARG